MAWLDQCMVHGHNLALVLNEQEYLREMRAKNVDYSQMRPWVCEGATATTHVLTRPDYGVACIVCMREQEGATGIEIAALLVHEAVHVFQAWCDVMGEHKPSAEFQAYSIQSISERLMHSYVQQTQATKE